MAAKKDLKGSRGDLRLARTLANGRSPRSQNARHTSVVGQARRTMRRKVRLALRLGTEVPAFVSIDYIL